MNTWARRSASTHCPLSLEVSHAWRADWHRARQGDRLSDSAVGDGTQSGGVLSGDRSILGVDHSTMGTYTSMMRPDGTVYGEAKVWLEARRARWRAGWARWRRQARTRPSDQLSRLPLLPERVTRVVTSQQHRRGVRIRSRRTGQLGLEDLGVEVEVIGVEQLPLSPRIGGRAGPLIRGASNQSLRDTSLCTSRCTT